MPLATLGYLIGAAILLYLARLMARRRVRQPGEGVVLALVVVTATFHAGRLVAQAASAVGGPGAAWLPRLSLLADTVAFGALAFLPALLLHTHLIVATNALAD
ncbi:MAG: hypothetical protein HY654_03720, partial [Acidobacteria bacterium]|nr:hypothetical protein [Acidobacteriota bacterium]